MAADGAMGATAHAYGVLLSAGSQVENRFLGALAHRLHVGRIAQASIHRRVGGTPGHAGSAGPAGTLVAVFRPRKRHGRKHHLVVGTYDTHHELVQSHELLGLCGDLDGAGTLDGYGFDILGAHYTAMATR